jgi:hypothetical protein
VNMTTLHHQHTTPPPCPSPIHMQIQTGIVKVGDEVDIIGMKEGVLHIQTHIFPLTNNPPTHTHKSKQASSRLVMRWTSSA